MIRFFKKHWNNFLLNRNFKKSLGTPQKRLDVILNSLNHQNLESESTIEINDKLKKDFYFYSSKELDGALQKLVADKYVEAFTTTNPFQYAITYDGILFSSNGGYRLKRKKDKRLRIIDWVKNFAIFSNAIILLWFGLEKYKADKNVMEYERKIVELDKKIDKMDSISHSQTTILSNVMLNFENIKHANDSLIYSLKNEKTKAGKRPKL
jgi:hypothetical protein